jgi:hypothetical protein
MDTKHRTAWVLGNAAIVVACLLCLLFLRGLAVRHVHSFWDAADFLFFFGFVAYLLFAGLRATRWGKEERVAPGGRVKWGRLYLGSLIVYIQVKNYFNPAPDLLQASNETQAQAMKATAFVFFMLGVYLVATCLKPAVPKREGPQEAQHTVTKDKAEP